jgi:hypothetical protein
MFIKHLTVAATDSNKLMTCLLYSHMRTLTDYKKLVTCLLWSHMKTLTDSKKLVTCLLKHLTVAVSFS